MYKQILNSINSLSAEEDKYFHKHLIETKFLKRLNTTQSDIVYGTKGVGKTALRRALTELDSDFYFNTVAIDLDSISFEAVYDRLSELNSTVKFEMHNLARATWKNILLNYALLGFIEKLPQSEDHLKKRIEKILKEEKFITPKRTEETQQESYRVLNTIENFFHTIISLPFPTEKTLKGITVEQQDIINKFPLNDKIAVCLKDVFKYLNATEKRVLVCIDGFDSIVKHTSESREAIFAGLIDAVYFFRLNSKFSDAFSFKAFLPQELTLEANRITWDGDKHANNIHYISWDESDFKLFIEKRFTPFSRRKQTKFNDLWTEFMPEKLINPVHNVDENTFEYILRHTLYRPRQVLNHIAYIIMRWDETATPNDKIHPSFIPSAVAKNNKLMAGRVVEHLSHMYPNIANFLRSWQGSSTIIEVQKFKEKIFRYLVLDQSFQNHAEIDKILDELFDFGLFGVKANTTSSSISKRVEFRFAFVGDNINSTIHNFINDDDSIAFSPMFREYCGCNSTPEGIIIPIALDNLK